MNTRELRTITFHREQILKKPGEEDLLTLLDADEHKLPAMDKLLKKMQELHAELKSVGLKLHVDKYDKYPFENSYVLTDIEHDAFPEFKIIVHSDWLNPKKRTAIHGGFEFRLHVVQDGYGGRYEIADWITISIRHFNTTPFTFASTREHIRTLNFFYRGQTYFHDIPMAFETHVNMDRLKDGFTFKTDAFNLAVNDACTVMQKIISRKQFLKEHPCLAEELAPAK